MYIATLANLYCGITRILSPKSSRRIGKKVITKAASPLKKFQICKELVPFLLAPQKICYKDLGMEEMKLEMLKLCSALLKICMLLCGWFCNMKLLHPLGLAWPSLIAIGFLYVSPFSFTIKHRKHPSKLEISKDQMNHNKGPIFKNLVVK